MTPFKITWKSLLGILAGLGAPVAALTTHPTTAQGWVAAATALGGWAVVGLERLADSKDFATAAGPAATAEVAKIKSDAAKFATAAQAEVDRLTPLAQAWENALAAAVPQPSPVPTAPPGVSTPPVAPPVAQTVVLLAVLLLTGTVPIPSDHAQTIIALLGVAVVLLGGLVHVVYNQGRMFQELRNVGDRTTRIEGILDGREAPDLPPRPPKRRRS